MTSKIKSMFSRLAAPSLKHTLAILAACVVGGFVRMVNAAGYSWDAGGSSDTKYSTPENWSDDTVPGNTYDIWFFGNTAGKTVTFDGMKNVAYVWVCEENNGSSFISSVGDVTPVVFIATDNGGFTASSALSIADRNNPDAALKIESGTYSVQGESFWGWSDNAKCNVNIQGGSLTFNSNLNVGYGISTTNTIAVANGGSLTVNGNFVLGTNSQSGRGTLEIGDANGSGLGTVTCGDGTGDYLYLAEYNCAGTDVSVNINENGMLRAYNIVRRGPSGGAASINFKGGTIQALGKGDSALIGSDVAVTIGTNGGTIDTNGKEVTVASAVTGDGTLYVKGGGKVTFTATPTCTVVVEGDTTAVDSNDNAIGIVQNTWRGASGAYWNVDSNWSAGSVPTADQIVKIDTDGTILISGWFDTDAEACKAGALVIDANVVFSSTFKRPFIYGISGMTAISGSGTLTLTDNTGLENYSASVQEITCGLTFGTNSDHSWLGGSTYGWKVSGATTINSTVQTDQPAEFAGPMTIGENGVINTTGKAVTVSATSVTGSGLTFTGTGAVTIPLSGSTLTVPAITTAGNLTVNGSGTLNVSDNVSVVGVLSVDLYGTLSVSGTGSAGSYDFRRGTITGIDPGNTIGVAMSSQSCKSDSVAVSNGYQTKWTVDNETLLTSLSGSGVIDGNGNLSVQVAVNSVSKFSGVIAGNRSLLKTGDGTLCILGNNTFTGSLIIGGGTLRLADVIDLDGIRHDYDAYDAANSGLFKYCEDGITIAKWIDRANDNASFLTNAYSTIESSTGWNGTAPVLSGDAVYSTAFRMMETTANVEPKSFFYVAEILDSSKGYFAGNWEFGAASTPCRWRFEERNSSGRFMRKSNANKDYSSANLWSNGSLGVQNDGNGGVSYPTTGAAVITAISNDKMMRTGSGANYTEFIGNKGEMKWYEYLTYTRELTYDEKVAVERYLMAKWGIGSVTYTPIPTTAKVEIVEGATLDLGGLTNVVVSSFAGAGTVQNGVLYTSDNVYTNTGALTIPAVDNMTVVLANGATSLTLTGEASGVNITATDEFLAQIAAGSTLTVTATDCTPTFASSLSNSGIFRNGVTATGDGVWVVGKQLSDFSHATYKWTGGIDNNWETLGNWSVDGYSSVAVPPQSVDTIVFPTSGEAGFTGWTCVLASMHQVASVEVYANATFTGAQIQVCNVDSNTAAVTGTGTITFGDNAGFYTGGSKDDGKSLTINNPIEITAAAATPAIIRGFTTSSSGTGTTITFEGDISGNGYLITGGTRSTVYLNGNNSAFSGTFELWDDRSPAGALRSHIYFEDRYATSGNAVWNINSYAGNAYISKSSDKSLYFGALNGTVYHSSSYYGYTFEIGAANIDSVFNGKLGSQADNSHENHIKKVGNASLAYSGTMLGNVEIESGTFLVDGAFKVSNVTDTADDSVTTKKDDTSVPLSIKFSGENAVLAVPSVITTYNYTTNSTDGGAAELTGSSLAFADPSAKIAGNSTYPICFSNAVNETHTWGTALAVTNTKGLKKLGAGTLKLSYAPAYAGFEITVAENGGSVVLPKDANITLGKFTKVDSETDTTKTLVYYKAAATVEDVAVEYGADFATADVTVSLTGDDVDGKEYKLTVGGETKTATAENGTVTFSGVATGHSTAYDSLEYSLSSDAVTVSGGSGSKTIADNASWFWTRADGSTEDTDGGSWGRTMTWSDGKTSVGEGDTFTPVASDASVVDVALQVCFGDANDDVIDLTGARAAVKIATVKVNDVDTLVFQALNNGTFVTLTGGDAPNAETTYNVALHLDYAARKYTVKIGETMMQYAESTEEDKTLLAMANGATAMSAVAFAGQGTLTSLVGETSEGYVAMDDEGTRYLTLDAALESEKSVTMLHAGNYGGTAYAKSDKVAPTGAANVPVAAASAEAAAASVKVALTAAQIQQGLKTSYYKTVATESAVSGTYDVAVTLDETQVAPTVAADADDSAMKVTTSSVSLNVTNTKAGLYYGIAAGDTPEAAVTVAAGTMTKCDTDGEDLNLTAAMPTGVVKYYKVIVDDNAPSSN